MGGGVMVNTIVLMTFVEGSGKLACLATRLSTNHHHHWGTMFFNFDFFIINSNIVDSKTNLVLWQLTFFTLFVSLARVWYVGHFLKRFLVIQIIFILLVCRHKCKNTYSSLCTVKSIWSSTSISLLEVIGTDSLSDFWLTVQFPDGRSFLSFSEFEVY